MNTTHIIKILDYLLIKELNINKTKDFKEYTEIFTDKEEIKKILKINTETEERKISQLINFLVKNKALIENKVNTNKRKKYYIINLNIEIEKYEEYIQELNTITHQNKQNYKIFKQKRQKALQQFKEHTNNYDERLLKWKTLQN